MHTFHDACRTEFIFGLILKTWDLRAPTNLLLRVVAFWGWYWLAHDLRPETNLYFSTRLFLAGGHTPSHPLCAPPRARWILSRAYGWFGCCVGIPCCPSGVIGLGIMSCVGEAWRGQIGGDLSLIAGVWLAHAHLAQPIFSVSPLVLQHGAAGRDLSFGPYLNWALS